MAEAASSLNHAVADGVGWWYVIAVNIFLFFALYCAFSRVGNIRLGRDGEKAEFGIIPWFLMLFSAGMGIGLVFFGVAEPLSHYVNPPDAFGNAPSSDAAAAESVGLMMLQWGLHPWAIYSVVGLGLAYMTFRRGRPLAIRWLLEPLLDRRRVEGWIGHAIDAVAIVGTLFGVATSLGFGVSQIMGGLEYLGWAERTNTLVIVVITVVTAVALWSVISGVHKGLKWLSNVNMGVAALLAVAVFILGPTTLLLKAIPENPPPEGDPGERRTVHKSAARDHAPHRIPLPATDGRPSGPSVTGVGGPAGRPSSECSSRVSRAGARSANS